MYKAILCACVFCLSVGCGNSGDGLLAVDGTVKNADGTPVTGEIALVVFHSTDGKSASAAIQPDGSFEAMTKTPGDGMRPGDYKVVLNVLKDYRMHVLGVPKVYSEASTTPLSATVDADHTHFDFVVEP
jgi:hypothetical protein